MYKFSQFHYKNKEELLQNLSRIFSEFESYKKFFATNHLEIQTIPNRNLNQIIEQSVFKTENDYKSKAANPQYYISNIIAAKWVIENYFNEAILEAIKANDKELPEDLVAFNYANLLSTITDDLILLDQEYDEVVNGKKFKFDLLKSCKKQIWKNPYVSDIAIFYNSILNILGQISYHTSPDIEFMNSISNLRMGLELRIRKLTGVMAVIRKVDGALLPTNFSDILEVLKEEETHIQLPPNVSISNIIRINHFLNIIIHSGKRVYVWYPIIILKYLDPIFCDNNCFVLTRETVDRIYEKVLNEKDPNEFSIYGLHPTVIE
jgi:hypothetical protein